MDYKTLRENYTNTGQRVRIFYGDFVTGKDWGDDYGTTGYLYSIRNGEAIGIFYNRRSNYGKNVNSKNVVKLMIGGRVCWQHPNYHLPKYTIKNPPYKIGKVIMADEGYTHGVYADGQNVANFKSLKKAERFVDFMTGKRMTK